MSLVSKNLIDKELSRLIRTKRQEKWLNLMMLLCELEDKFDFDLKHFRYDEDGIIFKDKKGAFVRVSL